ncbi:MAG: 23S rRNA (guanosine(2251)-2'-O)-methyltransferase RlmB [Bacteroidales bacterium]|nr:23S rRNA (guanosine(2251)-2'-O)-methyltransferase RlmB [Lentimicrobiaceae bacterium]MDD5695057.1 23S rRNA (guanosine(2251)-2'-O)-methyltransferase RlmB [Bacteroidales bacterium]
MLQKDLYIYGLRPVLEAIEAGKEVEKLMIQKGLKGELSADLLKIASEHQIPVQWVPVEKLNRLAVKNHQGVIAIASPISYFRIEDIIPGLFELGKSPVILILDGLTDVRNVGAIARTAECAGVDALIIPVRGFAQLNADAVKTSAGALARIPVCRSPNLYRTCMYLKNCGLQLIACTEKASVVYHRINYQIPSAIIMGAEDKGISSNLLKLADQHASIPLLGEIQSLNVSVATGVILYELVRQRQG